MVRNKLKLLSLDESPPPLPESPPSASPPWTELPSDITANILQRLGSENILWSAELVCTTWWKVCQDPAMWRVIQINCRNFGFKGPRPCNIPGRRLLDRSQGQIVDLHLTSCCDEELMYYTERCPHLRRLTVNSSFGGPSGTVVVEAVKKLVELEELHLLINMIRLVPADIESIGTSCPWLNSFRLVLHQGRKSSSHNEYAVAVSRFMPRLRYLSLGVCAMDSNGLEALLDGCPLLESLHLCCCRRFHLDVALGQKFEQIKDGLLTFTNRYGSSDEDGSDDDEDYGSEEEEVEYRTDYSSVDEESSTDYGYDDEEDYRYDDISDNDEDIDCDSGQNSTSLI